MAGWFQLARDIRNSSIYNMIYIILIISVIAIFLIIGYKSSSKSTPIGNKNDNTFVILNNVSLSKWKEKHEAQIKEEEDRLNNDYYNKYRYIEFDIAGIHYRTALAKETILSLDILSDIHFIKEPNNPYDKFAIKIVHDRKRIGYVPAHESSKVTQLIDNEQIYKIQVIDSGKDITSEYSDAIFITIRVYYTPTDEEIRIEKEIRNKEIEEVNPPKLLMPIEYPKWMNELIEELKKISVESEEKKWVLKKLRDNIRNSLKSYEKAIREDKEIIANNAEKRLQQYREELHELLK